MGVRVPPPVPFFIGELQWCIFGSNDSNDSKNPKIVKRVITRNENDSYCDYETFYYDDGSVEIKILADPMKSGWGFNYKKDWRSLDFKTKGWGSQ